MNRYTRLTPSRYNPRSMQEMMMLPMMQRKQHDASVAAAIAMGDIDAQAASVDRPTIDKVKEEYEGSINDYVETLNRDGFNHESTQGIINLSKKKKDLTEKYLNPAKANLAAMQQLQKDIMDSKINGGWSPHHAQAFAAKQIQQFKGTFNEDGSTNAFQGRMLPTYVEAGKRIDDAIANIGEDTKQSLMQQYGTHNFHDLMASTKISGKDKSKILSMVGMELQSDSNFLNSYRTEAEINGLNEFGENGNLKIGQFKDDGTFVPESRLGVLLYAKAMGASSEKQTYSFSNISDSLGLHKAKEALDQEYQQGRSFTSEPVERRQVQEAALIDKLLNPNKTSNAHVNTSGFYSWGQTRISTAPINEYQLNEKEKERYETLATKMKKNGLLKEGLDINSDEAKKAVGEYLQEYGTLSFTNKIITPNDAKPGSLDRALLYDTDIDKASKQISQHIRNGLLQVWDMNGNPVEKDDLNDMLEEGKLDYLGVTSPNNHIDQFKGGGFGQTIMPHRIGINGNQFYVGRNDSEMDSSEYQAATTIKMSTLMGGQQPGLAIDHDVDNTVLTKVNVKGLSTTYNPKRNSYSVVVKFADGKTWTPPGGELAPEQFNELIYGMYDNDYTNEGWKN